MVTDGVPAVFGPVRLRRFDATDVDNLVELDSDPEVRRYLFPDPPTRHTVHNETLPNIVADYELYPGFGQWAAESPSLSHVRTFHVHFDDPLPGTEAGEVEYAVHRADWLARHSRRANPAPHAILTQAEPIPPPGFADDLKRPPG